MCSGIQKGAVRIRAPQCSVAGVALLIGILHSSPVAAERCDDLAGRVVSVEGDVRIDGQPARMNGEICSDEQLDVGNLSRAAVRLEDTQTVVRIDQNSAFVIKRSETGRSWLDLLDGIIYLFSRRPESLRVDTPYVNAAIDGTEFVVEVTAARSEVTVIEGGVRIDNPAGGELRLAPGEAGIAESNGALARRVDVDPQNAVRWALHYPPIGIAERASGEARRAAALLASGDVDAATRILDAAPEDAAKLALESMIAVTRNRANDALKLAEQAVNLDPVSSVARTAQSYAHQARFDIDAALASARVAVRNNSRDAYALARLAELQLGVDETTAALASAREATRVDPENSLAYSILGYVYLIQLDVDAAQTAFAEAIARDPGDPLPHLGLGLATIRDGYLTEGREHIEVAASLDPNNALIRSYLGKAYFEERQTDDAAAQFDLAQSLDPEDPTSWFYRALLAQALNRPVDAYRDIERARALNDNRLIYQSRLLVDKSEAAGSLSLARIYTDLGFEQPAINESTRSIETDPTNFSAYRFLADSYAGRERHEAAQRSVLFQAALLQPLSIDPVQPYSQESDLLILPGTDPVDPSIREYSPLFVRKGFQAAGSLVGGDDRTFSDNLVFSGLHEHVAYSIGQFHYETDGFRRNANIAHDVYHSFFQWQMRSKLFLQADLQKRETDRGDLRFNYDGSDVDPAFRTRKESVLQRIGLSASLGSRSTLLLAMRSIDRSEREFQQPLPSITTEVSQEVQGNEFFVRLMHSGVGVSHSVGVDAHKLDLRTVQDIQPCTSDQCPADSGKEQSSYANYYYYAEFETKHDLNWTLGLNYTNFDDEERLIDQTLIGPRFGLRWRPVPTHELRVAASNSLKRREVADLTLEPSVLAGFNQIYDDYAGTSYVNVGVAYDYKVSPATRSGLQLFRRELEMPTKVVSLGSDGERIESLVDTSLQELTLRSYWNRILNPDLSLGLSMLYENFTREDTRNAADLPIVPFPLRIETLSVPLDIRFAHSTGFFVQSTLSLVHQFVERIEIVTDDMEPAAVISENSEQFVNLDFSIGMKLPTRRVTFRLDITNLLDEDFLFQGNNIRSAEPSSRSFSPGRAIVGRVSFSFR